VNAAMLGHEEASQFATAVLAYVSAVAGDQIRLRLSLAGHPPALVLRRDGSVDATGRFGTMLGLRVDPAFHETGVVLGRGDVMLLYTDGVTDCGPPDRRFGLDGLQALLATLSGLDPDEVVDSIDQAVLAAQHGLPRDDIALVALTRQRSG
jgi:phosphoserine phosphatase RsbU/P